MKEKHNLQETSRPYIIGFVLSLVLTLSSYFITTMHLFPTDFVIFTILILAIVQLIVQLIFFLHLNKGHEAQWNLFVFLSTVSIVLLIVVGSIWIMTHLNYNMSPQTVDRHIQNEEGIHK